MRKLLRPPGPAASIEYKQRFIDQENLRLAALSSPWRLDFSSADPSCICLLGVEEPENENDGR